MKRIEVPETFNDCVALQLRRARNESRLTQVEVAAKTGLTQGSLSRIEKGETPLTVVHLRKLCRVYKTDPGTLLAAAEVEAKIQRLAD